MAKNLNVQSLDFDEIKQNLITWMKNAKDPNTGENRFQDYDFTASSLNILIDLLAYNTHYMGFYAHMLANETFIDSATLKTSLASKAKLLNYIPGSNRASRATVVFNFSDIGNDLAFPEPINNRIRIPRGSKIKAYNSQPENAKRLFTLVDDVYIYNTSITGGFDYKSDEIEVFEGDYNTDRFVVDNTLDNQRFILYNTKVDINTIEIKVYDTEPVTFGAAPTGQFQTFKRASDFTEINSTSNVFFISMNEDGYYELSFGNDVYGKALNSGNYIEATYISCNGPEGNYGKNFLLENFTYTGYVNGLPESIELNPTITTISPSAGGMYAETLENMRFNIPTHYRRQNRCVTVQDYKNLLLSEYRNINSINVWGGEDNVPVSYGKVYICIKPLYGEYLSGKSKQNILSILKKYSTATVEPVIEDPDYLYINLDTTARFNPLLTNKIAGEIKNIIDLTIKDYDDSVLNKFDGFFSNVELNRRIVDSDSGMLTCFSYITLEKRFQPSIATKQTYKVDFQNQLEDRTFKTDTFTFRGNKCYAQDDGAGNIVVYYYDTVKKSYIKYSNETFGTINYKTGAVNLVDLLITAVTNTSGLINCYATPVDPDFFTKRNNILTINNYKVNVIADYNNESNKK